MIAIGITGPTGAGKTTALGEVERLGGAVIDCDAVYHEMLAGDLALQNKLENAFGAIRGADGAIDRKRLGAIVFRDPEQLERLNGIVQGAICRRVAELVRREEGRPLAAIDAIALLESPLAGLCQTTIAVVAPPELRVARIMAREGISSDYAWARVRAQRPDEYFTRGCQYTLVNDCATPDAFGARARALLQEILQNNLNN